MSALQWKTKMDLGIDLKPSLLKLPPQQKLAVEMRYYDEKDIRRDCRNFEYIADKHKKISKSWH